MHDLPFSSTRLGSCVSARVHHLSRLWHIQYPVGSSARRSTVFKLAGGQNWTKHCSWIFSSHTHLSRWFSDFRIFSCNSKWSLQRVWDHHPNWKHNPQSSQLLFASSTSLKTSSHPPPPTTTTSWVAQGDCQLMKRQRSTDPRHNSSYYNNSYSTPLLTYSRKPNNKKTSITLIDTHARTTFSSALRTIWHRTRTIGHRTFGTLLYMVMVHRTLGTLDISYRIWDCFWFADAEDNCTASRPEYFKARLKLRIAICSWGRGPGDSAR